ncbi:MAG: helix-turn-helix domain-containing protein [Bdellovibrio sp.]
MARQTTDTIAEFPGLLVIHQKIPGNEVGRHSHGEHEFFLPLQGEIKVQYEEKTVKAGPGRMLYVPPKLDHSFSSTAQGSGERVILLIENKLWQKHAKAQYNPTSLATNSLAKEIIFYLLIHQKAHGVKYFISALIETLVEALTGAQITENRLFVEHIQGKLSDERIRKSAQLINENLAEVSISEIAKQSGLSQRNFSRLFIKETGMTPKDYLILQRIEKAKSLLKETRLTITDISLEVGYNSLSKFIETFRKIEGILPSDFRK